MAETGKPIEIHAGFRFAVSIKGVNVAAFTECTLPALEVETFELKEGGQNEYSHKLPVRVKSGSITLRRGLTKGSELLKWYEQVARGDLKEIQRDVSIIMFDSQLRTVTTWNFYNAYPVKWKGPTLKSDQAALAIEEVELAYHGFDIDKAREGH
jgi:phage tail-like protein